MFAKVEIYRLKVNLSIGGHATETIALMTSEAVVVCQFDLDSLFTGKLCAFVCEGCAEVLSICFTDRKTRRTQFVIFFDTLVGGFRQTALLGIERGKLRNGCRVVRGFTNVLVTTVALEGLEMLSLIHI